MALQQNCFGVIQFRGKKLKTWKKNTYIILLSKLSPPVHPALKSYYVIKILILFSNSLRTDTRRVDYLCLSKGVDIYLSNMGQNLQAQGVCRLIVIQL